MTQGQWIYRLSDGMFLRGGYAVGGYAFNAQTEGAQSYDTPPNVVTQRFANVEPFVRTATAQEQSDAKAAALVAASAVSSRQKDQLASAARRLMLTNPTAWNAMTLNQKKAAVLAEADAWRDMRVWIEQHL